jgi:hypothetical protein
MPSSHYFERIIQHLLRGKPQGPKYASQVIEELLFTETLIDPQIIRQQRLNERMVNKGVVGRLVYE